MTLLTDDHMVNTFDCICQWYEHICNHLIFFLGGVNEVLALRETMPSSTLDVRQWSLHIFRTENTALLCTEFPKHLNSSFAKVKRCD